MIQIYIGDGKGKTTASVGLAIRAAGHGMTVLFMQFLKDGTSGEINTLREIPQIEIIVPEINYGFTFQMNEKEMKETAVCYSGMLDKAISSTADVIILDEAIHAINANLLSKKRIEEVLKHKGEVVLTGRDAPEWLLEKADYISEVRKIKHPYDKGIDARKGIEY